MPPNRFEDTVFEAPSEQRREVVKHIVTRAVGVHINKVPGLTEAIFRDVEDNMIEQHLDYIGEELTDSVIEALEEQGPEFQAMLNHEQIFDKVAQGAVEASGTRKVIEDTLDITHGFLQEGETLADQRFYRVINNVVLFGLMKMGFEGERTLWAEKEAEMEAETTLIRETLAGALDENANLKNKERALLKKVERLQKRATIDKLTGLYNREELDDKMQLEIKRAGRNGPLGVLMIDIDHFKKFNDTYGHLVGDQVLRAVANVIQREIRDTDFAGRYGGEEIMVVCPNTPPGGLLTLAEKISNAIANEVIRAYDIEGVESMGEITGTQLMEAMKSSDQKTYNVTASIGATVQIVKDEEVRVPQGVEPEKFFGAIRDRRFYKPSDVALYKLKHTDNRGGVAYSQDTKETSAFMVDPDMARQWSDEEVAMKGQQQSPEDTFSTTFDNIARVAAAQYDEEGPVKVVSIDGTPLDTEHTIDLEADDPSQSVTVAQESPKKSDGISGDENISFADINLDEAGSNTGT